ncbi:hypothetical protein BGZ95_008617, partial [Linnemannia exigua]
MSSKSSPTRRSSRDRDTGPTTSTSRPHPYADKRSNTSRPQSPTGEFDHLFEKATPQQWAIQPDEARVGDTALINAQALLVRLQKAQTIASAQLIHRLCEMHNMVGVDRDQPSTTYFDP